MNILNHLPSPNCDDRPNPGAIDTLVLHYTGMQTADLAIERLCQETAKVSAHYLIAEDGTTYQLVSESKRAWHAGISYWRHRDRVNDFSIGIELVNPGHEFGYRTFPHEQMQALVFLCQGIIKRYHILPINVVGHSDIAPSRKQDPGELFDWQYLAKHNIGIYHNIAPNHPKNITLDASTIADIRHKLSQIGYQADEHNIKSNIVAFKRRFCQHNISAEWDDFCQEVLQNLIKQYSIYK